MDLSTLRILLAIITVLFISCSDKNSKLKGEFLSGCLKAGASKPQCSCMFDRLESVYSPEELRLISRTQSMTGDMQAKMAEIAESCRRQQ